MIRVNRCCASDCKRGDPRSTQVEAFENMLLDRREGGKFRHLLSYVSASALLLIVPSPLSGQTARPTHFRPEIQIPAPGANLFGPIGPVEAHPPKVDQSPEGLSLDARFDIYMKSTFGPQSFPGTIFGAEWGQWRKNPPEWGTGAKGFGRQFASGYGRNIVSNTFQFGVAAADGEDPRYPQSGERGIWRRVRHAVAYTFVSRRVGGGTTFAWSRFAGRYGSALVSNAWYPRYERTADDTLYRGTTALFSDVVGNMFYEFEPDLKRKLFHHHLTPGH